MNKAERATAPAVGAAAGYFVAYWATAEHGWLPEDNLAETVAFAGAVCTYMANEIRAFFSWVAEQIERRI